MGTEDCLYLDIRAPADFDGANYPVMFWIHGGGNTTGTKNYYDFKALVESQDVVVVTINYRLGALGWFTIPQYRICKREDAASNFGTLDIIQALHWVRDNIHNFGGDKGNVTVLHKSAGGHGSYALLASPLAGGLFHRVIAQSGYTINGSVEMPIAWGATALSPVDPGR